MRYFAVRFSYLYRRWSSKVAIQMKSRDIDSPCNDICTVDRSIYGPKTKLALMVSYIGTPFCGLQYVADHEKYPTVESVLVKAWHKANAIMDSNLSDPSKIHLSRASRTDKGVHAAGQVVVAKLHVKESITKLISETNRHLPKEVKILAGAMVTKGFVPHKMCGSRRYEYILPLEVAYPNAVLKREGLIGENLISVHTKWGYLRLVTLFRQFEGTHRYHNYTKDVVPTSGEAQRYLVSANVDKTLVLAGEIPCIRITFHGSSFVLHQIRRMVGMVICCLRFNAGPLAITRSFDVNWSGVIPKAPGEGLLLDECIFEDYNKLRGSNLGKPVVFDEDVVLERRKFKLEVLYPHIGSLILKSRLQTAKYQLQLQKDDGTSTRSNDDLVVTDVNPGYDMENKVSVMGAPITKQNRGAQIAGSDEIKNVGIFDWMDWWINESLNGTESGFRGTILPIKELCEKYPWPDVSDVITNPCNDANKI